MVAEVSLGRAGIVLGLECSRLARNSADWHQLLELCGMTGTLICDEDGLYDPGILTTASFWASKGKCPKVSSISSGPGCAAGSCPRPAAASSSCRCRSGWSTTPPGTSSWTPTPPSAAPSAHLFTTFEATGSATACVKAFRAAGLPFPWRHLKGPRKGETDWKPLAHHTVLRVLHNPRYAGAFTYGRHAHHKQPDGKTTSRMLPRQEWISFIPGAHPGYITLEQYDANLARLTANAAAHGRDRAAGPPREGPALLQGIIICGRCGLRMTVRYHARGGQELPTYTCHRDGIENGAAPAP